MRRRAIIMDLDGTVCDELGGTGELEHVRLLPGSAEAIRSANESGFQTVLAAPARDVPDELHERVRELLAEEGARVDGIYPRQTGFFERARDEMGIDLACSYMVGDRCIDVEDGHGAGATSVLVLTGRGKEELEHHARAFRIPPDHVAPDLGAAVSWILAREVTR